MNHKHTDESTGFYGYKAAGYYSPDEMFRIYLKKKPNVMHRMFVKLFFGAEWVDEK